MAVNLEDKIILPDEENPASGNFRAALKKENDAKESDLKNISSAKAIYLAVLPVSEFAGQPQRFG